MTFRLAALACAAILLVPAPAAAFASRSHQKATSRALRDGFASLKAPLACAAAPDSAAFLRYLHGLLLDAASATGDAGFARRWPTAATFDAFAARVFLDLTQDPRFRVRGLDEAPCPQGGTLHDLLVQGSVLPDDDGRNRARVAYGADRQPLRGTSGPLPADPIVLDMGGIEGLASQAHAHYTLAPDRTSDPMALLSDPGRFAVATAVPGGPITLGPDMAREHFLLALLASGWEGDPDRVLTGTWLGAALHYVQDAADPLHTVQIGSPCVLAKAVAAFAVRAAATLGGYLGDLMSPVKVATDVVSNYHLAAEAHWDAALPRWDLAVVPRPIDSLAGTAAILDEALAIADETAADARASGPALYAAMCDATSRDLAAYGVRIEDGPDDPAWWGGDGDAIRKVLDIGEESVGRATASSARLLDAFAMLGDWAGTPEGRAAIAKRLLKLRMDAVQAREDRLKAWSEAHPEGIADSSGPFRSPAFAAVELLLFGLVAWRVRRWVARRSNA
jgi:hypothetical protein